MDFSLLMVHKPIFMPVCLRVLRVSTTPGSRLVVVAASISCFSAIFRADLRISVMKAAVFP